MKEAKSREDSAQQGPAVASGVCIGTISCWGSEMNDIFIAAPKNLSGSRVGTSELGPWELTGGTCSHLGRASLDCTFTPLNINYQQGTGESLQIADAGISDAGGKFT